MGKPEHREGVWIRRYGDCSEWDVIVALHGQEMVVQLPDYAHAVKWAQMEERSYKIPERVSEESPG